MSGDNKLKKNFIYQFAYRILTVITPLITSPYLSRTLGAEKLGIYSGTYAYANYYILFAILGIEFYGSRSIAVYENDYSKRKATFWNIYSVQFFSSLLSILVYYLTFQICFSSDRKIICILQGLWVVASGLDINWYFFGKQDFKITVSRNIFIKIVSIICIFFFFFDESDLPKYVFIMAFSMVISQGLLWLFLFKDIGFSKPQLKEVCNNIKPILFLFIPVLAMSVFHIMDKSMVDILSDERNGGYYYNVDRLINIPLGLITGLSTVMLPRISKLANENNSDGTKAILYKSSELLFFLSCAVAFGLGSIANVFVPVFLGPGFDPCIKMIEIFIPIILIKAMSDFIRQQFLIPTKKDKLYVIAVICGAFANLISNYFLILKKGALGAVIGTFIAETVVLLIELIGTRKNINFIYMFTKHSFYFLCGLIMFGVVKLTEIYFNIKGIVLLIIMIVSGGFSYLLISLIYWLNSKNSIFKSYVNKISILKSRRN